jgi:hypothetical protein
MALRNQLAAEGKAMGFEQPKIMGTRFSKANLGKVVDITIDLRK